MAAEVVSFDEAWANRITERIRYTSLSVRDGVEKLQKLVQEAQDGDAHSILGYASWTAYLADVLGDEPLRLARGERRELVSWLSGQGMSTRAIAPIVGVTPMQVSRDIKSADSGVTNVTPDGFDGPGEQIESGEPMTVDILTGAVTDEVPADVVERTVETVRTVTGLDGKTYDRKPPVDRRSSILDDARNTAWQLRKAIERVERIKNDDRFRRNEAEIMAALRPHLDFANEVLTDLINIKEN